MKYREALLSISLALLVLFPCASAFADTEDIDYSQLSTEALRARAIRVTNRDSLNQLLAELLSRGEPGIESFKLLLEDPATGERSRYLKKDVIEFLGNKKADWATPLLTPLLPEKFFTHSAAVALAKISPDDPALSDAIVKTFQSNDGMERLAAHAAVQAMGPSGKRFLPQLTDLAKRGDLHWTLKSIGAIGPEAKAAIPVLKKILDGMKPPSAGQCLTGYPFHEAAILSTLAQIGPSAENILIDRVGRGKDFRRFAIDALGQMRGRSQKGTKALVAQLRDADPHVKGRAALALAANTNLENPPEEVALAARVMSGLLNDPKQNEHAVKVLLALGEPGKKALVDAAEISEKNITTPSGRWVAAAGLLTVDPGHADAVKLIQHEFNSADPLNAINVLPALALYGVTLDESMVKKLQSIIPTLPIAHRLVLGVNLAPFGESASSLAPSVARAYLEHQSFQGFRSEDWDMEMLASLRCIGREGDTETVGLLREALREAIKGGPGKVLENTVLALQGYGKTALEAKDELSHASLKGSPEAVALLAVLGEKVSLSDAFFSSLRLDFFSLTDIVSSIDEFNIRNSGRARMWREEQSWVGAGFADAAPDSHGDALRGTAFRVLGFPERETEKITAGWTPECQLLSPHTIALLREKAVPFLKEAAGMRNCYYVLPALAVLGPTARDVIPAVLEKYKDYSPPQLVVARAAIGEDRKSAMGEVIHELRSQLENAETGTRKAAPMEDAICDLGQNAEPILAALEQSAETGLQERAGLLRRAIQLRGRNPECSSLTRIGWPTKPKACKVGTGKSFGTGCPCVQ